MLRRLLTCLALITGLAAFAAPANASVVEALTCEVGQSLDAHDSDAEERRMCEEETAKASRREPGKTNTPNKRTRRVVKPPVLFGVDRAFE